VNLLALWLSLVGLWSQDRRETDMRRYWVALVAAAVMASLAPAASADDRIVGGTEIDIEQVPWTLSLQYNGGHYCGAVLVAPRVALTAAHCTDGIPRGAMSVRAGSSVHAANGHQRAVARVIQHPRYSAETTDFDVSVLRLADSVPFSDKARAARVADEAPAAGTVARVSGWGNMTESGPAPSHLRAVKVPVVSRAACRAVYGDGVSTRMLCAGYDEGRKDSCQGDSGGPLTVGGVLVGIVSWGHGCARPMAYGVYANVAQPGLREWIAENAGV
jgi:trypsin